jgi:hypothetical protein
VRPPTGEGLATGQRMTYIATAMSNAPTHDLERLREGATKLERSTFGDAIISNT